MVLALKTLFDVEYGKNFKEIQPFDFDIKTKRSHEYLALRYH